MIRGAAGTLIVLVLLGTSPARAGAEVATPEGGGMGTARLEHNGPCLTDAQRAVIRQRLEENRALLAARGKLLRPETGAGPAVAFGWPLRLNPVLHDPGFHGLSNYVDHDPANPGFVLDPQCGARTYDIAGYNHQGTDLFLWPFSWLKMDHEDVQIVAAAAGQIIGKDDGNFDRSCGFGGGDWNAVYVQHADGSRAWYGHMKQGSLTAKPVGATVVEGEVLGSVGSSGNSTGPHLHLEVYDAGANLIDPYAGPCNNLNASSWWAAQRPYDDSALNALRTHDAAPEFPACPNPEIPHERNAFAPGETVYLAAYYRDQLSGQVSQYRVYDAGGTLRYQWSHSSPAAYYAASYWYWTITAPAGGVTFGNWRFEVTYQGSTTAHTFWLGPLTGVPGSPEGPAAGARLALGVRGANPARGPIDLDADVPAPGVVTITVLDVRGRTVARLLDGWRPAGRHVVRWDASRAPAGVYLARLSPAGGGSPVTHKLIVAD